MSKEDWKLKLFYDLAHNPNTAYCDTLRAVLPEEPTSANQEQALIYYHFTDSSQRSVYLEQIMAHSKKLVPLVRLILLYYLSFQAKREKDSVLERKNLNPTKLVFAHLETRCARHIRAHRDLFDIARQPVHRVHEEVAI